MGKVVHRLLAAAVFLLCSCSVKEDRMPCPSILTLDVSEFFDVSDVVHAGLLTAEQNLKGTVDLKQGKTTLGWHAAKGRITAYAYSNLKNSRVHDGIVTIPVGEQADPLRASCHRLECYDERMTVDAHPYRQSALVHLTVRTKRGSYPYALQAEGDICGIDLRNMNPQEGEFRCDLSLDSELSCDFRLPRQRPESKPVINVLLDGTVIDTFPLYAWIRAVDYDWTMDDLPEIEVSIDPERLMVAINVLDWEHEEIEIIL